MTAARAKIAALREAEHELPGYLARYFWRRGPSELTADEKHLILNCAASIHGSVAMFIFKSPGKLARPVQRLARTVRSGGRRWERAWNEVMQESPAVIYLLQRAKRGRPLPMYADVPPPADIAPLIPEALRLAKQNTKAQPFRDNTVISILQTYWLATGGKEPTPKQTRALIGDVGKIYSDRGLLPVKGFAATSSAKTLDRLIKMATGKLPIPA